MRCKPLLAPFLYNLYEKGIFPLKGWRNFSTQIEKNTCCGCISYKSTIFERQASFIFV